MYFPTPAKPLRRIGFRAGSLSDSRIEDELMRVGSKYAGSHKGNGAPAACTTSTTKTLTGGKLASIRRRFTLSPCCFDFVDKTIASSILSETWGP